MYTDRERAEKCIQQAQDSLFLTFFHALSCYAIFHITCHIRWTQPQPLGGHQFCGERMLANVDSLIVKMSNGWVTNVDSLIVEMNNGWVTNVDSLIVEMNNGWVTNALLAFLFFFGAFTSCTYVQIYISISYPTNVVILFFYLFIYQVFGLPIWCETYLPFEQKPTTNQNNKRSRTLLGRVSLILSLCC